ncbi:MULTISPECIES: endonuclease/exonuclease/phosphatase family protein [unclassified Microbacterium]|uniref:endonuclease/exonuclease/phosphatase family protein n=1 Tax=unclassified Microbacterium TaxID=2609290 RepID=UPI00214BB619|nr:MULTISPECIES: endonuclease/exonuclease/phosphatase family protein [unclassified Microbacterium]MCR2783902.1 endonuclease/exonuclease/phosphatase family protein [Microbacterium sp. zg.B96]WIM15253.1 endonuclease/exonuclease/phosphatase family protein [Microbacterium sp. zg-B96]
MTPLIGPTGAPDLHVMTFNVRRRLPALAARPADRWRLRRPRVQALLRAERPTLLGVQETLPDQAAAISDALGASYRFIGHGRQPGPRGEASPLFYDTDRLELLQWRQQALSDRPDEPGSVSWGNLLPRVLVQATFRDLATSAVFLAVNTHLDAFSARARVRAAQEISGLVADQPWPAIVTGDLNAGPDSEPVRELLSGDTLVDAWTAASATLTPEWGTYGGYRDPRPGRRIDWIAVSPRIAVQSAGINAQSIDGGWPSDHLPVQAVVRMPQPEGTA